MFQAEPIIKEANNAFLFNQINENIFLERFSVTSNHEIQYSKNYDLLRMKYKKGVNPQLNFEQLKVSYCGQSIEEPKTTKIGHFTRNQIYVFLSFISFYELSVGKTHMKFSFFDWNDFSQQYLHIDTRMALYLNNMIFKGNQRNFQWTKAEDLLLMKIMRDNPTLMNLRRRCWKPISMLFNKESTISQQRTAPQCKERWKNSLKINFKKGQWEHQEDLTLLNYVLKNGSKWSALSNKLLTNRTEHVIKNRFFRLVSTYISLPIRKIKKEIDYLNSNFIQDILNYQKSLNLQENTSFYKENKEKSDIKIMTLDSEEIEKSREIANISLTNDETSFSIFSCFDESLIKEILE